MNNLREKEIKAMRNNIKFDFITNTIIVNKGYYAEACKPGTEENMELLRLQKDYPDMRIALRSVRTGSRKSATKGLTYKYMRKFISVMDSENFLTFEKVIQHYEEYEEDNAAVYHRVKEWFLENYPYHKEMIVDTAPKKIVKSVPQESKAAAA